MLALQGAGVWSLVRGVRSCTLHSAAKKERKKAFSESWPHLLSSQSLPARRARGPASFLNKLSRDRIPWSESEDAALPTCMSTRHSSPVSREQDGQLAPGCLALRQSTAESLTPWKTSQPQANWDGWSSGPGNEGGTTSPPASAPLLLYDRRARCALMGPAAPIRLHDEGIYVYGDRGQSVQM